MFAWCYLGLIGCLFMGIIYCQLLIDIDQPNEPDAQVILSVDTRPKSSANFEDNQISEPFACHECINCNLKSDLTTRICASGINMCYTIHKRINNTSRVLRRGCSTSRGQCTVPNNDQSNPFDSVTCCTSHKCNQGIQFKPGFFLSILSLFIIINI